MILYAEASLIVALYTPESHSARTEAWFAGQDATALAVSDWVAAEVAAALAGKVRLRELDDDVGRDTWSAYLDWERGQVQRLPIRSSTFRLAATLASDRPKAGLRGGDALHLATAVEHRATLCTLDKRLARAAEELGCSVELI